MANAITPDNDSLGQRVAGRVVVDDQRPRRVDQQIGQTLGSDFDALIVPAGARSVQKLGANPHAERIISSFITAGKPMVFMGDAVELLAKIDLAKGLNVTGPERSHQILVAAGAVWSGTAEQIDGMLMTGEGEDMSSFIAHMAAHIQNGPVEEQQMAAGLVFVTVDADMAVVTYETDAAFAAEALKQRQAFLTAVYSVN